MIPTWLTFGLLAPLAFSLTLESQLLNRPTRGGIEAGIPGILSTRRPKSAVKYWLALHGEKPFQANGPTHVIVTSRASGLGTLFQDAAFSRAKKYAQVFPDHQVMLILVNEMDGRANADSIQAAGFRLAGERAERLSVALLIAELQPVRQIASIDIFGHANDYNGVALDADFIQDDSEEVSALSSQFTSTAWANLHGCSSGWTLAPALAAYWGIPVSGSFAGTYFQRLHSSGIFYPYDEVLAPPGPFARVNPYSFDHPVRCDEESGCARMHPENAPYNGMWGHRPSGLGFYKFFCGPVPAADCEKRMALSLLGFVAEENLKLTSSLKTFMNVLKEFMCPVNRYRDILGACRIGIDRALRRKNTSYSPFWGKQPICDATSCREPKKGEFAKDFMLTIQAYRRGWKAVQSHAP